MPPKLPKVLYDQIAQGGLATAVTVCNKKAPQMAKATGYALGQIRGAMTIRKPFP